MTQSEERKRAVELKRKLHDLLEIKKDQIEALFSQEDSANIQNAVIDLGKIGRYVSFQVGLSYLPGGDSCPMFYSQVTLFLPTSIGEDHDLRTNATNAKRALASQPK